jgi:hypothetical protein
MLMAKISPKLSVIIVLLWANAFLIYYLIDAIVTKGNIWLPIILLIIEIATIIIYRHVSQFGDKFNSIDNEPYY